MVEALDIACSSAASAGRGTRGAHAARGARFGWGVARPARRTWLRAVLGFGLARGVAHCSAPALVAALAVPTAVRAQGSSATAASGAASAMGSGAGRTILVVGDSLSAEYGLARGQGWVALLEKRLAAERIAWRVVNASISGDTTSGGRSRLPALLRQHRPQVLLIELGGNDALRGLPLSMTEANLAEMARAGKAAGARVLLAGMAVPPNYGRSYGEAFMALFAKVAKAQGTGLVPFLLAGVADGPDAEAMFQPDRIHPRAEAHPRILDNVWPALKPLLR
ncbi:MAG: arylesterase [Rubrivivax sp.]|nr:arylesterase [Rubrivivax sp.]